MNSLLFILEKPFRLLLIGRSNMQNALFIRRLVPVLLLATLTFCANAGEPVSKNILTGVAIGGHDTVAYYNIGDGEPHQAVEGNKSWKVEWKGANWLFTSAVDRDRFAANPERYSPAYNGYCANALSLGEGLIKTDGTHWQIFGDRLYTFYAARGRDRWLNGNFENYRTVADNAWKNILANQ